MIPHVIVLEPGLVVFKIYNGYWFFGRPTIEELRHDLRAVLKKCRPDWDITRPELKAAWEGGETYSLFSRGKDCGAGIAGERKKRTPRMFPAITPPGNPYDIVAKVRA